MGILTRAFVVASLFAGAFVASVGYSEGFGGKQAPIVASAGVSRLVRNDEPGPIAPAEPILEAGQAYLVPGVYAGQF